MGKTDKNRPEIFSGNEPYFSEDGIIDTEFPEEAVDSDSNYDRAPKGPLAALPSFKTSKTAIACFVLFYIATVIFNKYEVGNKLWVSGEAVFMKSEYWRLLTSLFVHADMAHLLSNAPLFIIFGWLLNTYFGKAVFPYSSFIIGIISNIMAILIYNPQIRLIGASGMVYGMAAQWLVYYIRFDTDYTISKRIFRAVGFSMALLFPTTIQQGISYVAHGAGFIAGLAVASIMIPLVKVKTTGR